MDRGQAGKEGGMGTGKGKREGIGRIGVCGGYDGVGVHREGGCTEKGRRLGGVWLMRGSQGVFIPRRSGKVC